MRKTYNVCTFAEAEKYSNIQLNFNQKLASAKLRQRLLTFQKLVEFTFFESQICLTCSSLKKNPLFVYFRLSLLFSSFISQSRNQ